LIPASPAAQAQATRGSACQAAPPAASAEPNIFSAEQEHDLGDVIAEQFESEFRVIADEALVAHLREIGGRLVRHLPPTALRISFRLIDYADANAFALPGGRVYVSRKLVAFTRSEDELAGVLGHELGHLVARQQTIALTRQLKALLGVSAVGDRHDIELKFNQLMDNAARRPNAFASESHDRAEQLEADRIGLFITAAAGYDASAHAALFARLSGTDANRKFFSRLFGTMSPDAKRLSELVKGAAALPPGCVSPPAAGGPEAYRSWQLALASYAGTSRPEHLPADVRRTPLAAFRGEVARLRFSPDGRFILAQDDAGVTVMTGDPADILFRIEAPGAEPAQFSADSASVLVHSTDLRIERWDLATRRPAAVRDLVRIKPCVATALSPDGRVIACVDAGSDLVLIDTDSGQSILQRDGFYKMNENDVFFGFLSVAYNVRRAGELVMHFSPDSRYFIAAHQAFSGAGRVVYDVVKRAPLQLPAQTARLLDTGFTFLSADKVLALNATEPGRSVIITLPAGTVGEPMKLPVGLQDASSDGRHVLIRPMEDHAVGVFDLTSKTIVKTSVTSAFDVHGARYVAERGVSDLGVHDLDNDRILGQVALPPTALGRLRATAVSADLAWVAVSERTRGVMWNVSTGRSVRFVRDFDGAFIDESGSLFADLPRAGTQPRAVMRLDSRTAAVSNAGDIGDVIAQQQGRWLLVRNAPTATGTPETMELAMRDVRRPGSIWVRKYGANVPQDVWLTPTSDAVVLAWFADLPAGQARIREDPALRARVKLADVKGDYVVDVLDAATGTDRGRVYLETGRGSFAVRTASVTGDRLFVTDTLGRVLQYSIASGTLRGYAFGETPVTSESAKLLAVNAGAGRVVLYDLDTMRRQREMTFSRDVVLMAFSADGASLFALTADQVAYVVSLPH
jgi:hypothetical protein